MLPIQEIEKQTSHSFSIKEGLYRQFWTWCYNNDTTPTEQIREFIINFLKEKNGEKSTNKK
jgi:hypothetical protein